MADNAFVLKNAKMIVNGVDLSPYLRDFDPSFITEQQDITAHGDSGRKRLPGFEDWSMSCTFLQSHASTAGVDATLAPLVTSTSFNLSMNPANSTTAATNPRYYGEATASDYNPFAGGFGGEALGSITFSGHNGWTRDEAAT